MQLQSGEKGLSLSLAETRMKEQAKLSRTESRFKKEAKLFIRQFTNPLILLLVIAVILSAILGQSSDSFIILFILVTTGLLGFFQELNAGRAMEKLRGMISMKHTILRDGQELQLSTQQIVAGDILILDAGDIIPADCRIIESNELHVNESTLTGESYPVEKIAGQIADELPLVKKSNCLWKGTNVISGTATVIVFQAGNDTIFGHMAHSLTETTETAFEKGIKHFGFFLLRITVILSLIILVVNLYFHKPLFDSVLFSLALAVGMAPELLPAIMTFAMSAGAKRMLQKKVIVKKLSSIFNFGEVNVLCTDKTGTITEGNVMVKDIVDAHGATNERIRLYAFLNASLQNGFSNPIDDAIKSLNITINGYKKINEIPYDFIRKRLSVAVNFNERKFFITKGAFNNVLEICDKIETENEQTEPLDEQRRKLLADKYISFSEEGYRVLGLAYRKIEKDKIARDDEQQLVFLGFILLEDPLKESTLASIKRLEELHISIKIITGDNRYAASHAAQKIGMQNPVIVTGEALRKLTPEAFVVKAKAANIFAEIEPQQKEFIIKALQKSKLTVAYIGDGINDAAAINAADIGISTNNAVDVAKEAADFVLLEKDLSVLADGVYEGRRSFVNSMKYIFITTGATFGNMFSVAGASLFLPFLPMLPKQILLTNLITDLPFLSIASDHVDDEDLVQPGKWNLKMISSFMIVFGLHSSLFDFITFYFLYFYFRLSGSAFQTGWFLESSITELLILFIIRTKKSFIKSKPGRLLLITGIIAFCITIYLPLSPFADLLGFSVAHTQQLITITLILVAYIITADILKIIFFRINERKQMKVSMRAL
nr:magnesium-translocating P-type ATPase [Panacibacter ginsenosidivorans]